MALIKEEHFGIARKMCIRDRLMTLPSKTTSPLSGCTKPAIQRSVVVLPQPEGPSSVITVSYTHLDVYKRQLFDFVTKYPALISTPSTLEVIVFPLSLIHI